MSELATQIPPFKITKQVTTTEGVSKFVEMNDVDLFDGKRIVIFGLPGAFTPTCSGQQLPGYEALYNDFRQAGIDLSLIHI